MTTDVTTTLVQKIEALAAAIGKDIGLLSDGTAGSGSTDTRLALLEAQWQSDMAKILDAQNMLRVVLDQAVNATLAGKTSTVISATSATTGNLYINSHLPAGFVYGKGGINRATGKWISGWQHVAQSIFDILSTPLGTRVMRRTYGSRLFDLLDRPMTIENILEVYLATAEALDRWEPRFKLRNVRVNDASGQGRLTLSIYGTYFPRGHLGDYSRYEEPDGVLVTL